MSLPRPGAGRGLDAEPGHRPAQRCGVGVGLEVDAAVLQDGFAQGEAAPGRREVDLVRRRGQLEAAEDLLGHVGHHLLHQPHDVLVVGVGLVGLQHGELRVVLGGDALVAEDAADLVDALEAADDEALEVELGGHAQEEGAVQGVVVGDEGLGGGPAGRWLEHRRLDLQEAALVQEAADGGDDAAAELEDVAHLGVGDEVQVALAVAHLDVLEAVPLLGRRPQGLSEDGVATGLDGGLAGAGAEEGAGHAHEVAQVDEIDEGVVVVVAQDVLAEVGLYLAGAVAQVDEGALAHDPHGSHPAGHADLLAGGGGLLLLAGEEVGRLLGGVGALAAGGIGVAATGAQALQLGPSLLDELFAPIAQRLLGFPSLTRDILHRHAELSFRAKRGIWWRGGEPSLAQVSPLRVHRSPQYRGYPTGSS